MEAPTLLFLLPERDHLVQLPLNQSVRLVFVQPAPTLKRLLDTRERTVNHHLEGNGRLVGEGHFTIWFYKIQVVWYLFTVPSGTNSLVVVADGDPAERADQFADLDVENVDEAALESTALQEDFAAVLDAFGAVHD